MIKAYARSLSRGFPIVLLLSRPLPMSSLCTMIALTGHHSREWPGELIEKSYLGSLTRADAAMMLISPAQGAVFAPLALKFVQAERLLFFFSLLTRTLS
jgi:hypothetical protein